MSHPLVSKKTRWTHVLTSFSFPYLTLIVVIYNTIFNSLLRVVCLRGVCNTRHCNLTDFDYMI